MDSSGGHVQTSQNSHDLPHVATPGDSREGMRVTQCGVGDSGEGGGGGRVIGGGAGEDGRVMGGGGCPEGTGGCVGGEKGGGERNELSPQRDGPSESDIAHISSILSKLPAIDTAAADDSATSVEMEINQ